MRIWINFSFFGVLFWLIGNWGISETTLEGTNLLGAPWFEVYKFQTPNDQFAKSIRQTENIHSRSWIIEIYKKPEKVHWVCLSATNKFSITKGDILYIKWRGKSLTSNPAIGQLFVQLKSQWEHGIANQVFDLCSTWQTWDTFIIAPQNYEPESLFFNFFFGYQVQKIELAEIAVINYGKKDIEVLQATRRPSPRQWDFESGYQSIQSSFNKAKVSGSLPLLWEDDSAWAEVTVEYSQQTNAPFSGNSALRVEVKNIRTGQVQFRVPDIRLEKPWFVKIRLAIRSTTSSIVKFGLRKKGPPYNYYGCKEVSASPEWQKTELLLPPVANDPATCLLFEIKTPGVVDLDEVEVSYHHPDEILKNVPMVGNLLTTSSFPLGVTYPWTPFHESYQPENYQPDPSTLGPTGLPSLKIVTGNYEKHGVAAVTSPFLGIGERFYTFSFWAKSAQEGHNLNMRIGPPSEKLWVPPFQQTITLRTEWERFHFTIKLPHSSDGFYLAQIFNWGPKGTFWIDGVQVEASDRISDFQRTGQVEIAMKPLKNSYGLFLLDEPIQIQIAIYGNIENGMKLKNILFDVWGKSYELPNVPLQSGTFQSFSLTIPEVGQPKLGSYRIESQVINLQGTPVSKISELLFHRIRPAKWMDRFLINSPFGVHITPNQEMPAIMRSLGFTWARCFGTEWQLVEKQKGIWSLERLDPMINNLHHQKFCILGILGGVPEWARRWIMPNPPPQGYNSWHAKNVPPKNHSDFYEYARRMAAYFQDRVQAWETWNEPFLPGFLNEGSENGQYIHPSPEQFYSIHLAAAKGIKEGSPSAWVVLNIGVHYNPPSDQWSQKLLEKGITQSCDVLSYHAYLPSGIGYPNDPIYHATRMNSTHQEPYLPVWNTEGGPGPSDIRNFYRHTPPLGKAEQSAFWGDYLVRYWVSTLASGAKKFFLYLLYGWGDYKNTYSLMNNDGRLHPCLIAFSNMAWHLEGKQYQSTQEIAPQLFAYFFVNNQQEVVAVLLSQGSVQYHLSSIHPQAIVRDLFGNDLPLPSIIGKYAIFIEAKNLSIHELIRSFQITR